MKKEFVEPKIKRIELNMKENIASSMEYNMGYYFTHSLFSCTIVTTGKKVGDVTEEAAKVCMMNPNVRIGGGTMVSEKEVKLYLKR